MDLTRCPTVTLAIARMSPEERDLCCDEISAEYDRTETENFELAIRLVQTCWTGRGAAKRLRLMLEWRDELRRHIESDPKLKAIFLKCVQDKMKAAP